MNENGNQICEEKTLLHEALFENQISPTFIRRRISDVVYVVLDSLPAEGFTMTGIWKETRGRIIPFLPEEAMIGSNEAVVGMWGNPMFCILLQQAIQMKSWHVTKARHKMNVSVSKHLLHFHQPLNRIDHTSQALTNAHVGEGVAVLTRLRGPISLICIQFQVDKARKQPFLFHLRQRSYWSSIFNMSSYKRFSRENFWSLFVAALNFSVLIYDYTVLHTL
ncbi:uncharacterized protein V6R79_025257 [Siganus canaliculatus]